MTSRLSWASPSLGLSPFHWPWTSRPDASFTLSGFLRHPAVSFRFPRLSPASASGRAFGPPLRHFGVVPSQVLLPVLQSFKEPESWLASFEAAGPFEVRVLVPDVAVQVSQTAVSRVPAASTSANKESENSSLKRRTALRPLPGLPPTLYIPTSAVHGLLSSSETLAGSWTFR
jgi:hypothetical protein